MWIDGGWRRAKSKAPVFQFSVVERSCHAPDLLCTVATVIRVAILNFAIMGRSSRCGAPGVKYLAMLCGEWMAIRVPALGRIGEARKSRAIIAFSPTRLNAPDVKSSAFAALQRGRRDRSRLRLSAGRSAGILPANSERDARAPNQVFSSARVCECPVFMRKAAVQLALHLGGASSSRHLRLPHVAH